MRQQRANTHMNPKPKSRKRPRKPLRWLILAVGLGTVAFNASYISARAVALLPSSTCDPELVKDAHKRLKNTFGTVRSRPVQVCVKEPRFGANVKYGTARFAPFLRTVTLMGPEGTNIDVIAHEWAHAELAARTGFLTRNYHLPVWFDEGLAMQFDDRETYSRDALKVLLKTETLDIPNLQNISKAKQFFLRGNQGKFHYALARCVVKQALLANAPDYPVLTQEVLERLVSKAVNSESHYKQFQEICLNPNA